MVMRNNFFKRSVHIADFENQLSKSLFYYGYFFPDTPKKVERFEDFYGDIESEIPDHLDSLDQLLSDSDLKNYINFESNKAAFSSKDKPITPDEFE